MQKETVRIQTCRDYKRPGPVNDVKAFGFDPKAKGRLGDLCKRCTQARILRKRRSGMRQPQ